MSIEQFFKDYKIKCTLESQEYKNLYSKVAVRLHSGSTLRKVEGISRDLALHLKAIGPAIIEPNYASGTVDISWLTKRPGFMSLKEVMSKNKLFDPAKKIVIPVGVLPDETIKTIDLSKAPHIIVGGTTGSGKSMWLHAAIQTCIEQFNIKCIIADPKGAEFSQYEGQRGKVLYCDNRFDFKLILDDLVMEMNERYAAFKRAGKQNISAYNAEKLHYSNIVLFVDELSDLVMSDPELLPRLTILSQKCRAAGIHIIAAAQNPSAKVFTGDLKANMPVKIGFKAASGVHSRVMLDRSGAEDLLGSGDGICIDENGKHCRFQSFYVSV